MKNNKLWFFGGLLLLAAALCFTVYNLWDEKRAGDRAQDLLQQYQELQAVSEGAGQGDSDAFEDDGVPAIEIDGDQYIGVLEIPALDIALPVMKEWSYAGLKIAPCRYLGSVSENDLIIAGHNYDRHFGGLRGLESNDEVIFTDAEDNRFVYRVAEVTRLGGSDVEEMEAGEWDLTLFTCTTDSQNRVTVRCISSEEDAEIQ